MIYLDNAATTQISPEVREAMMPYLLDEFGNPGTPYSLGRRAAEAVGHAREQVAGLFNCKPEQIIFTSGGSEANNLVLNSFETKIVSQNEHDSLYKRAVASKCATDTKLAMVNTNGICTPDAVMEAISRSLVSHYHLPGVVSVMYANNEISAVNPVAEIADMCHKMKIRFHTDCVQAAGYYDIDVDKLDCDFASISSHKIHGPKGVGALFARDPKVIKPIIIGGENQEFGKRGGTENVAGIVGFGAACEIVKNNISEIQTDIDFQRNALRAMLLEDFKRNGMEIMFNGDTGTGKILSVTIPGVDAQVLQMALDTKDIFVGTGSACRSKYVDVSRVLMNSGIPYESVRSTIRISFSSPGSDIIDLGFTSGRICELSKKILCLKC